MRQFDDWWIDCVRVADGVAGPAGRCAARTYWRDSISLLVLHRDGHPLVLVQTANNIAFDRGDSVGLQVGRGRQHTVTPQRLQTAIFSGEEGEQIVANWKELEGSGADSSWFSKILTDSNDVVVQVRQMRGSGRIARFSLKGFSLAMAALSDMESGEVPPAEASAAPAPSSGPNAVDDLLKRVLELFR